MKAAEQLIASRFGRYSRTGIKKSASNLAVIYTRVSGKEQFDTNLSLDTQKQAIDEYAKRHKLEIAGIFGGTYESAKTDGRKEFQKMLEFIRKSRGRIGTILVYKMSRFSRTGGKAIAIADELREKYGIHVIAVTEPIDTTNPNGILFHDMQLIFSRWDNEQRKQFAVAGMKAKIEKGIWVTKPPQGYDIVRSNGERKIVLNADGKKIKRAWEWKIQGMKNEEIIEKLQALGVKMYKQQMHKIFTNPFYCGLIAHGMLNGRIIEGTHEKMVSLDVFMKVNNIIAGSSQYGVPHKTEDVNIPLKVFIKCADCAQPFTGYIVKKKNLYYYKCRTNGCKCNKSAKEMHNLFLDKLSEFQVKEDIIEPLKIELENTYHSLNKENVENERSLKLRLSEIYNNIDKLEEKYFIREEMSKETYDKFIARYRDEQQKIMKELEGCSSSISNLKEMINEAAVLCHNLHKMWKEGSVSLKERLQKLIFPAGLVYDKNNGVFRTPEVNSVIAEIARISGGLAQKIKGLTPFLRGKSLSAVRTGL